MAIFNPSAQKKDAGPFASDAAQAPRRDDRPVAADFTPTSSPRSSSASRLPPPRSP